jgi:hypothetical protein
MRRRRPHAGPPAAMPERVLSVEERAVPRRVATASEHFFVTDVAHHVVDEFWSGFIMLDDPLITDFFAVASGRMRRHALWYVLHGVSDAGAAPNDVRDRIATLLTWRGPRQWISKVERTSFVVRILLRTRQLRRTTVCRDAAVRFENGTDGVRKRPKRSRTLFATEFATKRTETKRKSITVNESRRSPNDLILFAFSLVLPSFFTTNKLAHNPKVAGSNPAPATNSKHLNGPALALARSRLRGSLCPWTNTASKARSSFAAAPSCPPLRSDRRRADEPQCDEAALKR